MKINALTAAIWQALSYDTPEAMGLRVFQAHVRQGGNSPWLVT